MTDTNNKTPYILVAEDNSIEARAAADAALQIARKQNLMIRGLYVVEEILVLDTYADYQAELPLIPRSSDGGLREPTSRTELVGWFKTQGEVALQWLETKCAVAKVPVRTNLLAGGVSELVIRDAAQARILALGRRGHGHQADSKSLGNNFRKIAHQVHLPLLVGGSKTSSLHHLLLAYNGQEHADEALAWTIRLQRDLDAEVIVLSVCEDNEPRQSRMNLEAISVRLRQSGLEAYRFLTGRGRPSSEIAAIASANGVDLIILGGYRHAALVEWLVRSTVGRLLRATSLPILIT